MSAILDHHLQRCGLRTVNHVESSDNNGNRKSIARAHGFRKFFTTQAVNSRVNPEIREMLLGHKIGLSSAYYRPSEEEMLSEYEKAIDALTIDPANRLQRKVERLEVEKSKLDTISYELDQIKKAMHLT